MDHIDHKRSLTRVRETFPAIPPGRTSLSSSTETVTTEMSFSDIQIQQSYTHMPCPPPRESTKRQRPYCGRSSHLPCEESKRQRSDNDQKLTEQAETMATAGHTCLTTEMEYKATRSGSKMEELQKKAREDELLKTTSAQHFGSQFTPTPNLRSFSSEAASNRHPTPVVSDASNRPPTSVASDAKAERRRKRREKKEREARKMEEARKKEQDKLEAERMMAEISRNRSMFNGNKDTLPAIGRKTAEVNVYIGKLPKIQEFDITGQSLPDNKAVDVIKKHETQVRTAAFLKEISQDYINASAELMEPYNVNGAIDIIEKHEEEVGRTYAMYTGCYSTGSYTSISACKPASARSRCSSGVSRRGAA